MLGLPEAKTPVSWRHFQRKMPGAGTGCRSQGVMMQSLSVPEFMPIVWGSATTPGWNGPLVSSTVQPIDAVQILSHGIGAVSDQTLLRSYFELYRQSVLDRKPDDPDVSLWIGTLADGLFAGTFLSNPAGTIWDALKPRTAHLDRVLSSRCLELFREQADYYHSNPFEFTPDREEEIGYFIRLLTRGRFYLCKSLSCFDDVCPSQINPYLHPAIVDLALKTDSRLFESDALRDGVLDRLGPDLSAPSAYGYNAPAYSHIVFRALQEETKHCTLLSGRIESALIEAMSEGRFPALEAESEGEGPGTAVEYRIYTEEPQTVSRSLRDYEHLLLYTTFLNMLLSDGVEVS